MKQEVEDFIAQHEKKGVAEVALLLSKKADFPKEFIINQINGRQKAPKKLPFLSVHQDFIFPTTRAVEQSSSEFTARYKAKIVKGKSLIDLSGGMGIDSYFFSQEFAAVYYVEVDQNLCETTSSNFKNSLKANRITCHNTSAEAFLKQLDNPVDCIYIDPDRRVNRGKAFLIEDCEPNVVELLPLIFKSANQCLIKLSPMLDITQALSQVKSCKEVHIVSHNNECKELLFLLEKDFEGEVQLIAAEIGKGDSAFRFTFSKERESAVLYSDPLEYIYEPNVAILKAGAFKSIAKKYELHKLAVNTHVYTSSKRIDDFPGRVLQLKSVSVPKKGLTKKANVVAKNFSLGVDEIRKKYKIQDGGMILFMPVAWKVARKYLFTVKSCR